MISRAASLLLVLAPAAGLCQTPDFAGTWKLNERRSSVSLEAPLAGLIGAGAPGTLHITQPANGTLVVESQVNESHARLYVPGETTTTAVFLGAGGTITMTSRWEQQTLVSEGTRESSSGPPSKVLEVFKLSADGQTLELEVTVEGTPETSSSAFSSALSYTRIQDVGPCDSWPSPCKDFSRPRP
jgi:hypothetical protein